MPEPMGFELARNTVKWYGCSGCYGDLDLQPDPDTPGGYLVTCKSCGAETPGYVSQRYIERRRGESVGEALQVKRLLIKTGFLVDPLAGMSKEQKIRELGF